MNIYQVTKAIYEVIEMTGNAPIRGTMDPKGYSELLASIPSDLMIFENTKPITGLEIMGVPIDPVSHPIGLALHYA